MEAITAVLTEHVSPLIAYTEDLDGESDPTQLVLWKDLLLAIRDQLSKNGSLTQKPLAEALKALASAKESEWHLAAEAGPWSVRTAKMLRAMSRHLQQAILKALSTSTTPDWLEPFLVPKPIPQMKRPAAAPPAAATPAVAKPVAAKPAAATPDAATSVAPTPVAAANPAAFEKLSFAYDENLQALLGRRFT